jgi:hypothetical protein
MSLKALRCWDEVFEAFKKLKDTFDRDKVKGIDPKELWAIQNSIKVYIDNLQKLSSKNPLLNDRAIANAQNNQKGEDARAVREAAWRSRLKVMAPAEKRQLGIAAVDEIEEGEVEV